MVPRGKAEIPFVPPAIHELEREVMGSIWDAGSATVRDVMEALNARADRPRAYTTYLTICHRLDAKGLLTRERRGKTDVYLPAMSREDYASRRAAAEVGALVDEFGEQALVHFTRAIDKLEPNRRQRLRRLARE